ncbi:MAG: catechol 2,3-dioxygenase-like lactoylglutathione lyase family enzyme [Paracoccaceae bacterium]|jgi:catechol 2,3-dioxygenase-like lactoylglutathione lyase family enzyme
MATTQKEMPKAKHVRKDDRPAVAIGHVRIATHSVVETIDFFRSLGLRHIFRNANFGVLELRGGTHLIVSKREKPIRKGTEAPFDIMVDNLKTTHKEYAKKGFEPSEIASGSVHSSFFIRAPSGHKLKITSSHAGSRAI